MFQSFAKVTAIAPLITGPLDGISGNVTGAWSFGRRLFGSYNQAFFSESAGDVIRLFNQTGDGSLDFIQNTVGNRPAVNTAGPNIQQSALFNGSNERLVTEPMSNFVIDTAAYIVVSCVPITIIEDNDQVYNNNNVWGLASTGRMNVAFRTTGPAVESLLQQPAIDRISTPPITIVLGDAMVHEYLLEATNFSQRVDGVTETSIASAGPIEVLTNNFQLSRGANNASALNCDIFEVMSFNAIPTQQDRDKLVADMKQYIGI